MPKPVFIALAIIFSDLLGYDDARESFEAKEAMQISAVGKIQCADGMDRLVSSAILFVNQDTLIAAAHFNYSEESSREIDPENCAAIFKNGKGSARQKFKFQLLAQGGDHQHFAISRAVDWALLRLDQPASPEFQPLRAVTFEQSSGPQRIVFSDFRKSSLSGRFGGSFCTAVTIPNAKALISHDCETKPGSSGGAIIALDGGEPALLGMHVAKQRDRGLAIKSDFLRKSLSEAYDGF